MPGRVDPSSSSKTLSSEFSSLDDYCDNVLVPDLVLQPNYLSREPRALAPDLGVSEVLSEVPVDGVADHPDVRAFLDHERLDQVRLPTLWLHVDPDELECIVDCILQRP